MSRRDTIIVAVLVNTALLMVLFATAMHTDKKEAIASIRSTDAAQLATVETPSKDDLLNQYISSVPTLAETESDAMYFSDEETIAFTSHSAATPAIIPVEPEVVISEKKGKRQSVNVTVKKGDFLEKIARANNTTVAAVMEANNMSSTQLKVGQILKVPLTGGTQSIDKPAASVAESEYYIVKDGDNPWLIASRNKIKLKELLRLNGLDDYKAKRLRPGDRLRIR